MIARIELADLVRIERLEDSVRTGRRLLVLVLVNALVCVLAYVLLGGSAFLCEVYEGPPYLATLDGQLRLVPRWIHELSFWHAFVTLLTLPCLPIWVVMLAVEELRLHASRKGRS